MVAELTMVAVLVRNGGCIVIVAVFGFGGCIDICRCIDILWLY